MLRIDGTNTINNSMQWTLDKQQNVSELVIGDGAVGVATVN